MVPTNESHLLRLCVRIGFGGEVRFSGEPCRPPSEHQGRRPEDQIEVVQRQRARPALSPDVGKNALGQLRQNQIFFDNREPAGLHGANCEIRRDIVQAFARDMNKKGTMMMFLVAGA